MKNTMKISGIAGTVLFGFAALFKIQHWPGAGVMMTLGAVILAFVFLPSALGVLWKETHNKKPLFLFISAFLSRDVLYSGYTVQDTALDRCRYSAHSGNGDRHPLFHSCPCYKQIPLPGRQI